MPPSKDRMWTAWFMETQSNIIANELEYLENHSDESNLRLKKATLVQLSTISDFTFYYKEDEEASLDTQNCIDSVVLKPI